MAIASYDPAAGEPARVSQLALEIHLPDAPFSPFDPTEWRQRGARLVGWERGLRRPLAEREIAIDPEIGRLIVAVRTAEQAAEVRDHLRVVFAYGAAGPVGAHPVDRSGEPAATRTVDAAEHASRTRSRTSTRRRGRWSSRSTTTRSTSSTSPRSRGRWPSSGARRCAWRTR